MVKHSTCVTSFMVSLWCYQCAGLSSFVLLRLQVANDSAVGPEARINKEVKRSLLPEFRKRLPSVR